MKSKAKIPVFYAALFKWFCKENLYEELQGDLEETFYKNVRTHGLKYARRKYRYEILKLMRPSVMRDLNGINKINHSAMIKSNFRIGWRHLMKNKIYSLLNIGGLGLGMAVTILIGLWVNDELSWDRFHSNIDRLHCVYINRAGDNGVFTQTVVQLPLWEELKTTPGVKYVSPTDDMERPVVLAYGDLKLERMFHYVSEDFLRMFDFTLVKGALDRQLNDPSSLVLTESTARALFGKEDPLGKVLRMNNRADLTVSGVVKDPPRNSTLQFDCLIPFQVILGLEPEARKALSNWGNSSWNMYIELEEEVDALVLEERIRNMVKQHDRESDNELMLFPLKNSHLYSEFKNGKSVGGAIVYVRIFSIIAILILGLACINFINLSTARLEKRAKEVGIRKVVGSNRKQLVFQFITETMLMTVISLGLAIGLVEASLPAYNTLVGKDLFIDYANPFTWLFVLTFIFITGLISGSYPALFLSSLRPITVFKRQTGSGKQGNLPRKVLVTAQFFCSIGLIIGTVVIYSQLHHIKNRDVGYNMNNLLMVPFKGDIRKNYEPIKRELISQSLSTAVSASSSPLTAIRSWSKPEWRGQTEDQEGFFGIISMNPDYVKTIGAEIIQGRNFNTSFNDSASVILNKAALRFIGFEDPIGEQIKLGGRDYTVVGVLDDVIMGSPHQPAYRTLFFFKTDWMHHMLIRIPDNTGISPVMEGIEAVFKKYNPKFPFSYSFVDQEFARKYATQELIGKLANLFAMLAIAISCLGLFGLTSFTAERRTKEVGIRRVFGASVINILSLFSSDFTRLILIAFLLSAPVTWWLLHQWLLDYSYRVTIELWMVLSGGIVALLLTWIIVGIQVFRVAALNPSISLKNE